MKRFGKVISATAAVAIMLAGCGNQAEQQAVAPAEFENVSKEVSSVATSDEPQESTVSPQTNESAKEADSSSLAGTEAPAQEDNSLWKLGETDYSMTANLIQYGGEVTLTLSTYESDSMGKRAHLTVTKGDEVQAENNILFNEHKGNKFVDYTFLNIDEITIADSNFDNYEDIIVIGDTERGREVAICEFEKRYSEDYMDSFISQDYFSEQVRDALGQDISGDSVKKLLFGEGYDGTFATYKDAYLTVTQNAALRYKADELRYGLIYFNDDDIPDLVISTPGYMQSLYMYEDGHLYCPIFEWAYGAGGNAGYEYVEKKAVITNFNQDYAGAIFYYTYLIMDSDHHMVSSYALKGYNFDDLNGNDFPDEEETTDEALENAKGKVVYLNYTDENLTEAEIKTVIDGLEGESDYLGGELTYQELLGKL